MNTSNPKKPTETNIDVTTARLKVAEAKAGLKVAKAQARLAKRRRKEAKRIARQAKRELKRAREKFAEAELALAQIEHNLAGINKSTTTTRKIAATRKSTKAPVRKLTGKRTERRPKNSVRASLNTNDTTTFSTSALSKSGPTETRSVFQPQIKKEADTPPNAALPNSEKLPEPGPALPQNAVNSRESITPLTEPESEQDQ
jgi:hypothetical protein